MTTIDLAGAVAAALDTDGHWSKCPYGPEQCVACQAVYDLVERVVRVAAPVISRAVWSVKAEAAGVEVKKQWGARLPSEAAVRIRDDEAQARAMAKNWGGRTVVRNTYMGASEWRPADPQGEPRGLCGTRERHDAHRHDSATLGVFWCTGDPADRLPGAAERRRDAKQASDA